MESNNIVSTEVYNLAVEKCIDLLRSWYLREDRFKNVKKFLKVFNGQKGVLPGIKIIKKLIDTFNDRVVYSDTEDLSQSQLIKRLINNFDIIHKIIEVDFH